MAKATPPNEADSPQVAPLRKPSHGRGALRVGNPGNKGGGRKPDWLKQWCDDVLADDKSCAQVVAILRDKDHAAFPTMWKALVETAHGKASQRVEMSGELRSYVAEVPAKQAAEEWAKAHAVRK